MQPYNSLIKTLVKTKAKSIVLKDSQLQLPSLFDVNKMEFANKS